MRILLFIVLGALALLAAAAQLSRTKARDRPAPDARAAGIAEIAVGGSPVKVFDHARDRQERDNVPDAQITAWRDAEGMVSLMIPDSEAYRMRGLDLEHLTIDPHKLFSSTQSANRTEEQRHDYAHWFMGPYSLDGRRFYTLSHSEWYACLLNGDCATVASNGENSEFNSWTGTLNSFVSFDGGATWRLNDGSGTHVVADTAYRWTGSTALSRRIYRRATNHSGMFQPTRVIREGAYFYAIAYYIHRDFSKPELSKRRYAAPIDRSGYVLARTADISSANGWEAWTGGDHFEPLANGTFETFLPIRGGKPLNAAPPQIIYDTNARCYILIHTLYGGANPVSYMTTSTLSAPHWSDSKPIAGTAALVTGVGGNARGFNDANYPSIIDADSPGYNFEFTSGHPQLFFVTSPDPQEGENLYRDVYRVPLLVTYDRHLSQSKGNRRVGQLD